MQKLACPAPLFAGLVFSLLSPVFSQVLPFHYYTIKDGLLSNGVNDLCQDSRGFLWLATAEGVSVYDGNAFTNYQTNDGLALGNVLRIIESRTVPGTMWIATLGGRINKYQNGSFTTFQLDTSGRALFVNALAEDYAGSLWCTASGTVYRMQNGRFSEFRIGQERLMAETLAYTPDSLVWIASGYRLHLFSPKDDRVTASIDLPRLAGYPRSEVNHMFVDREGDVWIGTTDSLLLQIRRRALLAQRKIMYGVPQHIMDDEQGTLWIGTKNGLLSISKSHFPRAPFRRYTTENGLLKDYIVTGLVDHENNLWFSHYNEGLCKLSNRNLYRFPLKDLGVWYNNSRAVADNNGHLWISSGRKLVEIWRREDGQWHQYLHHLDTGEDIKQLTSLVYDAKQRLWVNTQTSLVAFTIIPRAEAHSKLIEVKHLKPDLGPSAFPLHVFAVDRRGYVWVTITDGRVAKLDPEKQKPVKIYTTAEGLPGYALVLYQDREQNIWLGGFGGGLIMLPAAGAGKMPVSRFTTAEGLPDNEVRAVIQDREGKIWVGTRTGGLAIYANGAFKSISVRDGLVSNAIWAMAEDDRGRIWLATAQGVQTVDSRTFRPDPVKEDLIGAPAASIGIYRNQFVWFVTQDALHVYEFSRSRPNLVPPLVYITKFQVNARDQDLHARLEFAHHQNHCTIDFVGISFTAEKAVRYQWRLLGVETDWHEPTPQHTVTLAGLGPGHYTFEVRAINADGVMSTNPARLSLTIVPPFWQRWWFRLAVVVTIAGVLLSIYKYRIARLREIEHIRARIAADLHDELASSLASVRLYSEVLQRQIPNPSEETQNLLGRIRDLSEEVMEGIGHIIWSVDPRHDQLSDLLDYIQRQARQLCAAAGILLHTQWPEKLKSLSLPPAQRRSIYLILKEALTNALRHARCSEVELACTANDGMLEFVLRDNGGGFDLSVSKGGHGLANMRRRAAEIGAQLEIESQPGAGTVLRLHLKMT